MNKETPKRLSTAALAKKHGISLNEMMLRLHSMRLIERKGERWYLADEGRRKGGKIVEHERYGKRITWPMELDIAARADTLIASGAIGRAFGIPVDKINFILSEIGWIYKGMNGWFATPQGVEQGGVQDEDRESGVPYVRWPATIIQSPILVKSIKMMQGATGEEEAKKQSSTTRETLFREQFTAKLRAADGHYVRSKGEMLIDNWLYMAGIVHAYERRLPIEENVYSAFYLPQGKLYIEYWGKKKERRYQERKAIKKEIYKKYRLNLVELTDKEVKNLDDILPKLLLQYKILSF